MTSLRIGKYDTEGYIHHKIGCYAAALIVEKHLTLNQTMRVISKKLMEKKINTPDEVVRKMVRNVYTQIFTTT